MSVRGGVASGNATVGVFGEGDWTLFSPSTCPDLHDLFGTAFEAAYTEAEAQGLYVRQIPARELYARMMRSLAHTGNGWMTFKDASNAKCNQTGADGNVVQRVAGELTVEQWTGLLEAGRTGQAVAGAGSAAQSSAG